MAVPKKRTGHSAQGHRRSNWKATKPETTKCPNCGATVLAHTVCTECGTYKGKPVSLKDRDNEALVKKTKKAAKAEVKEAKVEEKTETKAETKSAKKSKKSEAKADEVKAEEAKTETSEQAEKTEE